MHTATVALAVMAMHTGCVVPSQGAIGGPATLYAASSVDGTITRLDSTSGRVIGAPLPAGPAPWQVVPGPDGSLLALSLSERHVGELTHVFRVNGRWATRTLTLPARSRADVLIAGDGGRYAVAAYATGTAAPGPAACELVAIDLSGTASVRALRTCALGESIVGLAIDGGGKGTVVYAGVWRAAAVVGGSRRPGVGAVLAIDAKTGGVLGQTPTIGAMERLAVAAAPARVGRRLYGIESVPGPDEWQLIDARWRLLGFDPATLELESAHPLDRELSALAFAPDGDHLYALAGGSSAGGSILLHVNLLTSRSRPALVVPATSAGSLVVTAERVYVPHPLGSAIWAVDRRLGRVVQTIPVGRHPLAITLGAPAQ